MLTLCLLFLLPHSLDFLQTRFRISTSTAPLVLRAILVKSVESLDLRLWALAARELANTE